MIVECIAVLVAVLPIQMPFYMFLYGIYFNVKPSVNLCSLYKILCCYLYSLGFFNHFEFKYQVVFDC